VSSPKVPVESHTTSVFVPAPISGEPTRGTTPQTASSDADEAAARAVAAAALRHGRAVEAVIPASALVWQVPPAWWANHRNRPYEVVFFRNGSPAGGVGDVGTSAVVRATPDSTWTVVINDGPF
jgi:hypothetical protein